MNQEELYQWIKLGGLLSFLPFILLAGPLLGWWVGSYAIEAWHAPSIVLGLCVFLGMMASLEETVRLIRLALKMKKNHK